MTDSVSNSNPGGLHVAIIMDGNGRWAERRGLPRAAGHAAGAERIRGIVPAIPSLGVDVLTLYAFSASNWSRPAGEVLSLMKLFEEFFRSETAAWRNQGVRVSVIGRRDRLPATVIESIESAESATRHGGPWRLRIAIDYSGQEVIIEAARRFPAQQHQNRDEFASLMAAASHADPCDPSVDLVIRTGGDQRLSDFLLWELAYAELWFSRKCWPDFTEADLAAAIKSFRQRERRYGRLDAAPRETLGASRCSP